MLAAKGVAIGVGLLIIGFEFEYSDTGEDFEEGVPSLRTGMGNVLLQTPLPLLVMRFYVTVGGGGAIVSHNRRERIRMPRWVGLVSLNLPNAESTAPCERMPARPLSA